MREIDVFGCGTNHAPQLHILDDLIVDWDNSANSLMRQLLADM
jgi:hypothetical protein